jgi:hypothetical protein
MFADVLSVLPGVELNFHVLYCNANKTVRPRNLRLAHMIRRRLTAAAIALILIPVGIAWRMSPLHLPPFLYKYGGSVLWAAMIYWLVAALLPRLSPRAIAVQAALIATFVEFSRLYHAPALDAFRLTLAGKLILGRVFAVSDIAAYWLAIAVAAAIDWRSLQPPE